MRVHIVDPPAYTPPYDHALCTALAAAGADVELVTSHFGYGAEEPQHAGYRRVEAFYRWNIGPTHPPGSRVRRAARLAQHVPDMVRYARPARGADVVHFQWLAVQQLDARLLPRRRPRLLTAHDVLPREPRPGQLAGQRRLYEQMDAVVVHSEHGAERLRGELGLDPGLVHVIPHGAFHHLAAQPDGAPLPPELPAPRGPVVLCFGLMRPYKGIDVLLEAWRAAERPEGAELWLVGMPRMDIADLRASAPAGVRWVPRFVDGPDLAAVFRAASLVVLPYRQIDQSGVLFTALAFGSPLLLTAVGGFPEVAAEGAAELVEPGDPDALGAALGRLLADPARLAELGAAARALGAPGGPHGWDAIARRTLALYAALGVRDANTR